MSTTWSPCANIKHGTNCANVARFACKNCRLVCYCGRDCQKEDWASHKKWCKSPLMKEDWVPKWSAEMRLPAFAAVRHLMPFGGKKYLYGNAPAFDCLKLEANEGLQYEQDIHLLFAASGDLRNVIKTINSVPDTFDRQIHVVINDKEMDVVARNAIMVISLFLIDDPVEAADIIIHLWYSSLIKKSHLSTLQTIVRPQIQQVCDDCSNKPDDTLLCKTWVFNVGSSVRLTLSKKNWMCLLGYFEVPGGLSAQQADKVRKKVTKAPSRRDFHETGYAAMKPAHRVARERFHTDGLLLPFGASRADFTIPNPTMYQQADTWPMEDLANPFQGWLEEEMLEGSSTPASADRFGILCHFLERVLRVFQSRLREGGVNLEFFHMPAEILFGHLPQGRFARIEVSNVCDHEYLGFPKVLLTLGPLLQTPSVNPSATLIMLFMGAVAKSWTLSPKFQDAEDIDLQDIRAKYLGMSKEKHISLFDHRVVLYAMAQWQVRDCEAAFKEYLENDKMELVAMLTSMEVKTQHTIIAKWPRAMKLSYGQPGAQEEFDAFMESQHGGNERYMEWKRAF